MRSTRSLAAAGALIMLAALLVACNGSGRGSFLPVSAQSYQTATVAEAVSRESDVLVKPGNSADGKTWYGISFSAGDETITKVTN